MTKKEVSSIALAAKKAAVQLMQPYYFGDCFGASNHSVGRWIF